MYTRVSSIQKEFMSAHTAHHCPCRHRVSLAASHLLLVCWTIYHWVRLRGQLVLGLDFAGDPLNLNGNFLTNGIQAIRLFDLETQTYRMVNTVSRGRWYPSVTVMADGNLLVVGDMQQVRAIMSPGAHDCTYNVWSAVCTLRMLKSW